MRTEFLQIYPNHQQNKNRKGQSLGRIGQKLEVIRGWYLAQFLSSVLGKWRQDYGRKLNWGPFDTVIRGMKMDEVSFLPRGDSEKPHPKYPFIQILSEWIPLVGGYNVRHFGNSKSYDKVPTSRYYWMIPHPLPKPPSIRDSSELTSIFMQISLELLRGTVIHLQFNVN